MNYDTDCQRGLKAKDSCDEVPFRTLILSVPSKPNEIRSPAELPVEGEDQCPATREPCTPLLGALLTACGRP